MHTPVNPDDILIGHLKVLSDTLDAVARDINYHVFTQDTALDSSLARISLNVTMAAMDILEVRHFVAERPGYPA